MYKNKKTRPAARTVGCLLPLGAGPRSAAHAARRSRRTRNGCSATRAASAPELLEKGYDFKLGMSARRRPTSTAAMTTTRPGATPTSSPWACTWTWRRSSAGRPPSSSSPSPSATAEPFQRPHRRPRAGHISSVQEVPQTGGYDHAQLWLKQQTDGALDVNSGRFGEARPGNFPCDFQNLAFCGSQVGNWAGHLVQLAGQPVGVAGEVQLRAGLVRAGRRLRAEPVEPGGRQRLKMSGSQDQGRAAAGGTDLAAKVGASSWASTGWATTTARRGR